MDQTLGSNRQTPSAPACESIHEGTASTQSQQQNGDVGGPPPVACPRCNKINNKKRRIKCSRCSREWHLSCVRLTRAQADALTCWWCAECLSSTGAQPPPPAEAAGADESMPESTRGTLTDQEGLPSAEKPAQDDDDLALRLAHLKQTRQVIRRIPKGARIKPQLRWQL